MWRRPGKCAINCHRVCICILHWALHRTAPHTVSIIIRSRLSLLYSSSFATSFFRTGIIIFFVGGREAGATRWPTDRVRHASRSTRAGAAEYSDAHVVSSHAPGRTWAWHMASRDTQVGVVIGSSAYVQCGYCEMPRLLWIRLRRVETLRQEQCTAIGALPA